MPEREYLLSRSHLYGVYRKALEGRSLAPRNGAHNLMGIGSVNTPAKRPNARGSSQQIVVNKALLY